MKCGVCNTRTRVNNLIIKQFHLGQKTQNTRRITINDEKTDYDKR